MPVSPAAAPACLRRPTRMGRRTRPESVPMERDNGLPLLHLEHDITEMLAQLEQRAHCAELSMYFDGLEGTDRVYALAGCL